MLFGGRLCRMGRFALPFLDDGVYWLMADEDGQNIKRGHRMVLFRKVNGREGGEQGLEVEWIEVNINFTQLTICGSGCTMFIPNIYKAIIVSEIYRGMRCNASSLIL